MRIPISDITKGFVYESNIYGNKPVYVFRINEKGLWTFEQFIKEYPKKMEFGGILLRKK